jgi:hypothetical protein
MRSRVWRMGSLLAVAVFAGSGCDPFAEPVPRFEWSIVGRSACDGTICVDVRVTNRSADQRGGWCSLRDHSNEGAGGDGPTFDVPPLAPGEVWRATIEWQSAPDGDLLGLDCTPALNS